MGIFIEKEDDNQKVKQSMTLSEACLEMENLLAGDDAFFLLLPDFLAAPTS